MYDRRDDCPRGECRGDLLKHHNYCQPLRQLYESRRAVASFFLYFFYKNFIVEYLMYWLAHVMDFFSFFKYL